MTKKLLVEIKIPDVISPRDIEPILGEVKRNISVEKFGDKVVVISGRMPIWLAGALVHYFHPAKAVAVFDPRLQGGVVVETHTIDVRIGDVVKTDDAEKITVEYRGEAGKELVKQ